MALFAIAAALFITCGISIFAAMIVFHLNRYAVTGDRTAFVRRLFMTGNLFFLGLVAFAVLTLLQQ